MKNKKKGIGKILIVLGIVAAIGTTTLSSYALIDGTNAVHITSSRIENATLLIGTHLIYIGSMNDCIYDLAVESAKEANQHKRYYKSEINGGTWYDVTEAQSLADITTEGVPVSNKEVEALYLTHHTKSDGLTYYLKKNTAVCIYDINDPYNLEVMTELAPIKRQYDIMVKETNPSETIKRDLLYVKEIYKFDRKTDETKELDEGLTALQTYYKKLVKEDAPSSMSDVVLSVMEKLDASRRVKVLEKLNEDQLLKMSQVVSREFTYVEGEITGVTDAVTKYQKEKAEEASKEAEKQTEAEVSENVKQLEAELAEIKEQRDTRISDKKNDITEDWDRIIALETDSVIIAEYKKSRDEEIKKATDKITKEYESRISTKENEITKEKNGKNNKVQQAGVAAASAVTKGPRETLEGFVPNTELLAAISEAMLQVNESYLTYSSKVFEEGTTVLSQTRYRFMTELVEKAKIESYESCDRVVEKLMYLDRIDHSIVREEALEKNFIENELLKEAQKSYRTFLSSGTGQAYKLLTSAASANVKENTLKDQLSDTEKTRNELQFILQAYIDRMSQEVAVTFLEEKIVEAEDFRSEIKTDAYKEYALSSVDRYEMWLKKTLNETKNPNGNRELETLILQKDELQTEMLTALDENKLEKAKELEMQIEALAKEIEEMENALSSSTGETVTSGTVSSTLQGLKEDVLKEIQNGNYEEAHTALEGLGALMQVQPAGALEALKEVYRELAKQELLDKDSEELNTLREKVEEITAENITSAGMQYSEGDLAVMILAFLTGETSAAKMENVMSEISPEETAVVLAGLGIYQEQYPSETIKETMDLYGKVAFNSGNSYVYEQLKEEEYEAIPSDRLSKLCGYRYIFSDSAKTVTLQKGNQYYTFEAFSDKMQKGNELLSMTEMAGFQEVIYLPEDAVREYFGWTTQYLAETSYGVMLSEEMEQQAVAFAEFLISTGEEY